MNSEEYFVIAVYSKCTSTEKKELWSNLEGLKNMINSLWCIGGDFNVILHPEEKTGGRPHRNYNSFNFSEFMDTCGVKDVGFIGSKLTWCNNWTPRKRVWKRLDRVFINDSRAQKYNFNTVKHLARTCPDHRPMLFKCDKGQANGKKYVTKVPMEEEIKDVMFNMSTDSAAGPDGRWLQRKEIVQNFNSKNKGGNAVIKVDMIKLYGRMSWPFIEAVLRNLASLKK
ncbi:uncharacterized protein LOC124887823 [Capsicum annuum]|uniref:uncharacterized protein LOC124887823 n=1 Tax=Capsicum annuum TaxID=4072 RepID=UPI001FB14A28|nr:uncharacterized protein LOC124887823 [Capsicum annuum]